MQLELNTLMQFGDLVTLTVIGILVIAVMLYGIIYIFGVVYHIYGWVFEITFEEDQRPIASDIHDVLHWYVTTIAECILPKKIFDIVSGKKPIPSNKLFRKEFLANKQNKEYRTYRIKKNFMDSYRVISAMVLQKYIIRRLKELPCIRYNKNTECLMGIPKVLDYSKRYLEEAPLIDINIEEVQYGRNNIQRFLANDIHSMPINCKDLRLYIGKDYNVNHLTQVLVNKKTRAFYSQLNKYHLIIHYPKVDVSGLLPSLINLSRTLKYENLQDLKICMSKCASFDDFYLYELAKGISKSNSSLKKLKLVISENLKITHAGLANLFRSIGTVALKIESFSIELSSCHNIKFATIDEIGLMLGQEWPELKRLFIGLINTGTFRYIEGVHKLIVGLNTKMKNLQVLTLTFDMNFWFSDEVLKYIQLNLGLAGTQLQALKMQFQYCNYISDECKTDFIVSTIESIPQTKIIALMFYWECYDEREKCIDMIHDICPNDTYCSIDCDDNYKVTRKILELIGHTFERAP
jgi:hypothetical protein